jgi:hypothetical protein
MIPAASVLALASILVIPAMRHAADPVHVSLSAERGSGTPAVAPPQGRNLQLHLDSSGLPDGEVSVEIVDSSGNAIGVQQALARANQVTIGVSHLASGLYYVRIRSGKEHRPDSDQLLREFAFQVR